MSTIRGIGITLLTVSTLLVTESVRADVSAQCQSPGSEQSALVTNAATMAIDAAAWDGPQAQAGTFDRGPDPEQWRADQARLQQHLIGQEPDLADAGGFQVELDPDELAQIAESGVDAGHHKLRVGLEKAVAATIDFSGGRTPEAGALGTGGDGEPVWAVLLRSPGATAVRLRIDDLTLVGDTALYVYNEHGQAFGPYNAQNVDDSGGFWTNTIFGESLRLQLVGDTAAGPDALAGNRFVLAALAHIGSRFQVARMAAVAGETPDAFCAFNASCIDNAECYGASTWPDIDLARRAIAHYTFQENGSSYICSGGLLRQRSYWQSPFFLTADHCVSSQAEASSIEAYWQFQVPCGQPCVGAPGTAPSTLGATLLSGSAAQDYAFLLLSQLPPSNSILLGWTTEDVANNHGMELYRISHPGGAPQAFSKHSVSTSRPTCGALPRGNYIYSFDLIGATEGGSSGSPVVNIHVQAVGQLYGACGSELDDVCDWQNNSTVDGAFREYYQNIRPWIDDRIFWHGFN